MRGHLRPRNGSPWANRARRPAATHFGGSLRQECPLSRRERGHSCLSDPSERGQWRNRLRSSSLRLTGRHSSLPLQRLPPPDREKRFPPRPAKSESVQIVRRRFFVTVTSWLRIQVDVNSFSYPSLPSCPFRLQQILCRKRIGRCFFATSRTVHRVFLHFPPVLGNEIATRAHTPYMET